MRIVVVTGASSGVGLEVARRFTAHGDTVIGIGRDEGRLGRVADELGAERFLPMTFDVSNARDVEEAFQRIGGRYARIDVLVNNAARFRMAPLEAFSLAEIEQILDTNLKGTVFCTRAALPWMQRGGRIIQIASVSATHGIENQAVYCASKFGMNGFAEALGQELLPKGIHVTTLCPGGIATPLWNEGNPYPGDLSRLLTASDVGELVEYVANLPERVVFKKAVFFPSNEWH